MDELKLDRLLRLTYRKALTLPSWVMNDRLLEVRIYNTASELFQAHYMNQVIRLARTKAGRTTLEELGINPPTQVASKRSLPPEWQQDIITRPLPHNMHPVHHENRRAARAKAYDKYSDHAGAFFVDAAGPLHNRSTATSCTQGTGGRLHLGHRNRHHSHGRGRYSLSHA
ncbi:hypothetical protein HPB49_000583 [Dermacentor silvarum]|uniref:Uncharacterized protein n=1 Tax=Dermacentor silvarum TaxID=543639 RepID=A0ACB8C6H5_DERSI|nr:hypothetical protein HPB49_000583 [Dermacentor silvarum]